MSLPPSVPGTLAAQQGRESPHRHYPCLKANAKHKKGMKKQYIFQISFVVVYLLS